MFLVACFIVLFGVMLDAMPRDAVRIKTADLDSNLPKEIGHVLVGTVDVQSKAQTDIFINNDSLAQSPPCLLCCLCYYLVAVFDRPHQRVTVHVIIFIFHYKYINQP